MMDKIIAYGSAFVTVLVISVLAPFRQYYPGIDNNAFRKVHPGRWSVFFRIPMGDVKEEGIALPLFVEQLTWYVLAVATFVADALLIAYVPEVLWLPPVVSIGMLALQIVELLISTALLKRAQKRHRLM